MEVKINVDTSTVVRLAAEALRQVPYAANNAIARTANEAAESARQEASGHLEIRKNFLLRRIRILHYPRANNLTAVIGVDANVQGSPLILGLLEEGGEKKGSTGGGVAVPLTGSAARPSFADKVTPKLLYKRLDIERHVTERGRTQWKGKQRTFVIAGVGIFQRTGPEATSLLYRFKEAARIGPHVRLRDAMIATIKERFTSIFNEEFAKELRARAVHLASK